MHKLYANRPLLGNIALAVFIAFLVTLVCGGMSPAAADPEITPRVDTQNRVAIEDRYGNWILPGGDPAKIKTTAGGRQIKFTVQVLTDPGFDAEALSQMLKIFDRQGREQNPDFTKVENLKTTKVDSSVYHIYQFIYTWRYGQQLEIPGSPNYEFLVTTSNTVLASIYLDLEAPPPEGGGGGAPIPKPRPAPVPTEGGIITIEGPGKAILTADAAKVGEILKTPGVQAVVLALDKDQAGEQGTIEVAPEILEKIFEKGKNLLCEIAGVTVLLTPGSLDVVPFLGESATLSFKVAKADTAPPRDSSYRLVSGVSDITCRAYSGGLDRGAVRFNKPVELGIAYDPALLDSAGPEAMAVYRFDTASGRWEPVPGSRVDRSGQRVTCRRASLSTYAAMAYRKSFRDTLRHWAQADIEMLAARHIITGIDADRFAPEKTVTRAELAAMVGRLLGLADSGAGLRFKDVSADAWYAGVVTAAAEAGLVKGYDDGTFRPEAPVTRQEIAAILVRALESEGKKPALTSGEIETITARFRDRARIGGWAQAAVAAAVKGGVITGRQAETFAPREFATRAEVAAMLKRVLNKLEI
ncbi:MAG: S-layer homology domain-containing protein [Bacillota bacterium]